jgi:hypothetical protein
VVGRRWQLRPAALRGQQAIDPVMGDDTGVRIHADPAGALVYLRLPGLMPRKVDTPDVRFKNHPRQMGDSTALPRPLKGRTWHLDVRQHELFLSEARRRCPSEPWPRRTTRTR